VGRPMSASSIVHALVGNGPSNTLCGKWFSDLPVGESALGSPLGSSDWITCPVCRRHLTAHSMSLEEYEPKSTLIAAEHHPTRARYPFIDIHNHLHAILSTEKLDQLVKDMDEMNLQVMVNLSGGYGETLTARVRNVSDRYARRFAVFANIDFSEVDAPDYARRAATQLQEDMRNGAQGLKIFKNFGMDLHDSKRQRIPVDDPRFDELFDTCAVLKFPVLIHTAEPQSFFDPLDRYNERWLELKTFPARARPPEHYPPWQTLLEEQHRLFSRHPNTIFINAHLGWLGGNLDELGRLMNRLPNMYTDIAAVLAELGRQPRHARDWFIQQQDRVLFGKDSWNVTEYHTYFRVLETADEYFDHYRKYHCFWKLYGLDLPDPVLRKLYYENALKILPGIDRTLFRNS
jgi:uncharacterized protein